MGIWRTAVRAARRAAEICRRVQEERSEADALAKADASPVTVADFAAQAVICAELEQAFPQESVVAEESSRLLQQENQREIREAVVRHVARALGRSVDEEQVLAWIDRGAAGAGGAAGAFWVVDPIDGTKGFLRGQQYAVALARVEKGQLVLGVLACPNLSDEAGRKGLLLAAMRGQGAFLMPLWSSEAFSGQSLTVSRVSELRDFRLCESVEGQHGRPDFLQQLARYLGVRQPVQRWDGQVKYAMIALGQAEAYLRLPVGPASPEHIWDHAAGTLIVQEAGGQVSDLDGRALDFSKGRLLAANRGVLASNGAAHAKLLEAIHTLLEKRE